ncbi:hypothetical protein [uncultured Desulfosarcina sp.]|uniref:hypothetical protein n=1 Tax=uncultured Desulfosarcina sp. TaxID=218289 RepID=UPI0029C93431|nr:hypothetical protein [uncultured Desulfosarcina sp.]
MKHTFIALIAVAAIIFSGCESEKISPQVVKISVEFTWEGLKPCGWGNPEIYIKGVPENTKFLKIGMYDHAYSHDHGTVRMPYAGELIIAGDHFKEIQGPCPVYAPGRYEITIKAMDADGTIIAIGSSVRPYPEEG